MANILDQWYEAAVAFIRNRQRAYQLVFGGRDSTKRSPAQQLVIGDLARFCRANTTTFHADPRMHAVLEGRREVYLRITQHLNLSAEEVYTLVNAAGPQKN